MFTTIATRVGLCYVAAIVVLASVMQVVGA